MVQSILAGGEGQCSDSSRVPVPVVLSLALSDLLLKTRIIYSRAAWRTRTCTRTAAPVSFPNAHWFGLHPAGEFTKAPCMVFRFRAAERRRGDRRGNRPGLVQTLSHLTPPGATEISRFGQCEIGLSRPILGWQCARIYIAT